MGFDIRQIDQFLKINGTFRSPSSGEDGKLLQYNSATGFFDYVSDIKLSDAARETATNRLELTLSDGTKIYVALGSLAWLDESGIVSGVSSVFSRTGNVVAQAGDYNASQVTNAFDKTADTLDNILEGATNKFLTAAILATINTNATYSHTHTNKAILDLITDAGGGVIPSTAQIAAWDSYTSLTDIQIRDVIAAALQDITGLTWTYDNVGGTITPTLTLAGFTTDNLEEGSINKYATSESSTNFFTLNLAASSDVATRLSGLVSGTDYPAGWTLAATGGVNLKVTNTLIDKKIVNVLVYEIDGSDERLVQPFADAYSGILANGNDVIIEGLDTNALALRVELIFT